MTVQGLYDKLASKGFQDPANSDLFYNFFIYQYPAEREVAMRRDIVEFKENLVRPVNYIDVLTLDIFAVFREYLNGRTFGKHPSLLKYLIDKDTAATNQMGHDSVTKTLRHQAGTDEFMQFVHDKIIAHISQNGDGKIRPYVFLYGFGTIYPYLRANDFLSKYEAFNKANRYKIILFYPGVFRENRFSLFGKLNEDHAYRAHVLMN